MITKSVLRALGVLTAAALVPVIPARAATVTIKTTTCLRRTHADTQAFLKTFADPINAMHTSVKINYLGGPEVTPVKEQAAAMKRGLIDMIECPAAYYSGMFGAARIPGIQNVSVSEIHKNGAWNIMEMLWKKNLNGHILAWLYQGGDKFYTYFTKKPKFSKKTGLDLSGMKMRSTSLYNQFLTAMGATTVDMPPSSLYTALQRGVVDGFATTWGSIARRGWQHIVKYRVGPPFFGPLSLLVMNLDKWNGLSKVQQHLLTKQAHVLETKGPEVLIKLAKIDDSKLKAAGVKFITLKGEYRRAYIKTIYGKRWTEVDKVNKDTPDFEKLKSLLYHKPGA